MADTPSQITQYQTGFAPEIAPYGQAMLGQAAALTNVNTNPYQQYQGDTIAQFTPLQQQAYQNAALMQTSPQLQDATAMAGMAGLGGLNTAYTFQPQTAANNYNPTLPGGAQAPNTGANTPNNTIQGYMNPYLQSVLNPQLQAANQQAAATQAANNAQATTAGAFGGGRQAVMQGQNQASNAMNQANIIGTGYNNAYNQALGQFNTENQLNAQQNQFGANLGLQGLNTALQSSNALNTLGNSQYNQNMGQIGLQNQLGGQQQQQVQNVLNTQQQNFLNAQNYPYQQLNFMSNLVRGLPMTQQSASMYQAPPNALSQVAGIGLTAAGLGAFKAAKGGSIKENTSRGLADLALAKIGA